MAGISAGRTKGNVRTLLIVTLLGLLAVGTFMVAKTLAPASEGRPSPNAIRDNADVPTILNFGDWVFEFPPGFFVGKASGIPVKPERQMLAGYRISWSELFEFIGYDAQVFSPIPTISVRFAHQHPGNFEKYLLEFRPASRRVERIGNITATNGAEIAITNFSDGTEKLELLVRRENGQHFKVDCSGRFACTANRLLTANTRISVSFRFELLEHWSVLEEAVVQYFFQFKRNSR